MYYPSLEEFRQKAKQGNLIPVYKEILADLETPVSAFCKISQGSKYAFLLESVEGGEKLGRYSFLGSFPSIIFKTKGQKGILIKNNQQEGFEVGNDPLIYLRNLLSKFQPVKVDELPRFYGGAVGFLSYDYVRFIENLPDINPDCLDLPDALFVITNTILIFDHISHTIKVVSNAFIDSNVDEAYQNACVQIEEIIGKLCHSLNSHPSSLNPQPSSFSLMVESNFTKQGFEEAVRQIKEYISAGDIFQAVLSQRFSIPVTCSPLNIYRALRRINPSPYMYYLQLDDLNIIGSSPEILVRVEEKDLEIRPIAGTRPRGKSKQDDELYEKDLLSDPKEKAEHLMLVDLGRNDAGRVCEYETINLPEFMIIERYSHVMHIVSSVKGRLAKGYDQFDALRACFPAGTVSGAPKIRAMEIIEKFEPDKRGPYAGCVGYFSFSGNLDTAITIRTIIVKDNKAYIQVGAGIVADSIPENEFEETVNKAKGMIKAIEMASKL